MSADKQAARESVLCAILDCANVTRHGVYIYLGPTARFRVLKTMLVLERKLRTSNGSGKFTYSSASLFTHIKFKDEPLNSRPCLMIEMKNAETLLEKLYLAKTVQG